MRRFRELMFRYAVIVETVAAALILCSAALFLESTGYTLVARVVFLLAAFCAVANPLDLMELPQQVRALRRIFLRPGDRVRYLWTDENDKDGEPVIHTDRVASIHYGCPTIPRNTLGLFLAFENPTEVWLCRVFVDGKPRDIPVTWLADIDVILTEAV